MIRWFLKNSSTRCVLIPPVLSMPCLGHSMWGFASSRPTWEHGSRAPSWRDVLKFSSAVTEKSLCGPVCSVCVEAFGVDRTSYRNLFHGEMDALTAVGCGDGVSRRAGQRCYGCQAIVGTQGDERHMKNATSCMS